MVPLKDHVTLTLWHYDTRGGEDMYLQEYPVEIPFDLKDYSAKKKEALIFKASGTSG